MGVVLKLALFGVCLMLLLVDDVAGKKECDCSTECTSKNKAKCCLSIDGSAPGKCSKMQGRDAPCLLSNEETVEGLKKKYCPCKEGYVCVSDGTCEDGTCRKACSCDSNCPKNQFCNKDASKHYCAPKPADL